MKYRIAITMTEYGYVDVEAPESTDEATLRTLALEENDNGGFVSTDSEGDIGEVIESY